jgi:hypothetical protein
MTILFSLLHKNNKKKNNITLWWIILISFKLYFAQIDKKFFTSAKIFSLPNRNLELLKSNLTLSNIYNIKHNSYTKIMKLKLFLTMIKVYTEKIYEIKNVVVHIFKML